ncbi:MAG: hypothetical protein QM504_10855 [Pseudomonadota bacterium]
MNNTTFNNRSNIKKHLPQQVLAILAILSFLLIIIGIDTIINNFSPENLSTYSTLIDGFFNNIGGHAFILIGALLYTVIIWDLTRDSWGNDI